MAEVSGLSLYEQFLNYLYQSEVISVPKEYHERCKKVYELVDNDISGTVNSLLNYAINSASNTDYGIKCTEQTLQKLLNMWLNEINFNINGVPSGLGPVATEYFKERWQGSSFCILRVSDWKEITANNVAITVPTTLWLANGSSIFVERPDTKNYKLGSDKFYLDADYKYEIPANKNEQIIVQKPFDRWFAKYSTPYLVRNGVLKNWLAMQTLQSKSDEVIAKILPYLFLITKGDKDLFLQSDVAYTDDDLRELVDNFKTEVEKYSHTQPAGKIPTQAVPFDQKYEHLIPDLRKILTEELYRQGFRSMLAGLGFIDLLEITPSRQEDRLNPKPFIAEVNNGVDGFKSMLLEVIYLIVNKNKSKHQKLFSDSGKIIITNSPLKINTEKILDAIRSGYDRGPISIESYVSALGFDYDTEKEKRIQEYENGDESLFYPHITQNLEQNPDDRIMPSKPKNEKNEDQDKKGPEKNNFKNAEQTLNEPIDPNLEAIEKKNLEEAPYDKNNPPDFLKKYPKEARDAFIEVFNKLLKEGKPESYAYPIAWNVLKRVMKKLKKENK